MKRFKSNSAFSNQQKIISKRSVYFHSILDALPILMGFVPIGIAYGAVAQQAGMRTGKTLLMSLIVFAGAVYRGRSDDLCSEFTSLAAECLHFSLLS